MKPDETASAYGLFQAVYSDVIEHAAGATFLLQQQTGDELQFEKLLRKPFKSVLESFEKELSAFEDLHGTSSQTEALRCCCLTFESLREWRNERVHARVRLTDEGYQLYNARARCRLYLDPEEIEQKIKLAYEAIMNLKAHFAGVIGVLDRSDEIDRLFASTPEDTWPDSPLE